MNGILAVLWLLYHRKQEAHPMKWIRIKWFFLIFTANIYNYPGFVL